MQNKNILSVCPGHNSSATLIYNNKIEFYIEEERLSRLKYDHGALECINYFFDNYDDVPIHDFVIIGTNPDLKEYEYIWNFFQKKYHKKYLNDKKLETKFWFLGSEHHKMHAACAFYNSGFDEALSVVVDGAGSLKYIESSENSKEFDYGFETESIFLCKAPTTIEPFYLRYGNNYLNNLQFNASSIKNLTGITVILDDSCGIVKAYEGVTDYLGFHFIESGKTMGLSSYGKSNEKFKDLFKDGRGNKNYFRPLYPRGSHVIDKHLIDYQADKKWHENQYLVNDTMKDIAFELQDQSQKEVLKLIEHGIKKTKLTNVVISGGYGLNCVANYFFRKNLPENINLYIEPISHDGGTSIGAAKLINSLNNTENMLPYVNQKQTSIYYGPLYKKEEIIEKIDKNLDSFDVTEVSYQDIVDLLVTNEIICIFQGRSEAGPRALGNRSILFDPRVKNVKDIVNGVKKREWFRPFAGTVLLEKADQWFNMAGLRESPFMMYAVDVLPEKSELIPSIVHVDNTCRIQTVTEDQNLHFYNLIKEFENVTQVPILFNTSFNLAGEPLVETIEDAISTLKRSELKYLYLPELGKLLTKKDVIEVENQ